MEIRRVGICGSGLMGSGIAQACAASGFETIVYEVQRGALDKGLASIRSSLEKFVEKGKLASAERDATLARLRTTTEFDDLAGCDLVVEAIVENMEAKRDLFARLDALLAPHALICSNTSSLCVIEMAAATKRSDRIAGLHFFNPVPIMRLVEVVRTIETSDATIAVLGAFAQRLGKRAVHAKDTPGFVVNRLLVPYLLDAIRIYEQG
ncbi:MAG: 3-hydroxybutyryl-CoA dehydrogenase, partial [bacterium]|nr:3-hydroxybutyryl-CoA dehydrogenase [bacterium]